MDAGKAEVAVQLRALLFDLDGTLVDTAPDFVVALNWLLQEEHRDEISLQEIRPLVSMGSRSLVCKLFGLEPDAAALEPLTERLLEHYQAALGKHAIPFPGADTLLRNLATRDIPWGIVTNKPVRYARQLLRQLGLLADCRTLVCPDHVTCAKPDPEPILLACRQLDCPPDTALMLGDDTRDMESAARAGAIRGWAGWGYGGPSCPNPEWAGELRFESLGEVEHWLNA